MLFSFFGKRGSKLTDESPLEERIFMIQKGDQGLREALLSDYQPFIKTVVSKVCKRYIDQTMDEYSIGLLAFNQAIDQYKKDQGSKFLSFADLVIRRRVIDYIRKEARRNQNEWLDQPTINEDEEMEESLVQQKAAMDVYQRELESENRVAEIEAYENELQKFEISFEALSQQSPKHADARENAKQVAWELANDPELAKSFLETKQLPIKELLNRVTCSRKTVERNRKYIIAITLIYMGQYPSLKAYIEPERDLN